jgi:hypothetical protein
MQRFEEINIFCSSVWNFSPTERIDWELLDLRLKCQILYFYDFERTRILLTNFKRISLYQIWRKSYRNCRVVSGGQKERWRDLVKRLALIRNSINPLSPELNPISYLLALLALDFLHVSRIRVKSLTLRLLTSYIYIYIWH